MICSNLLNSTGIATVFLDEKLRIRRFTPTATTLFKFHGLRRGTPGRGYNIPPEDG